MINTLTPATAWCASIAAVLFAAAMPALAQAPTDAQRSAIRSECRADYQAHCASIQPGGMASLQCLQQNMSSLSPGCQSAVRAVEAPATAPKAEQAPPPAAPAAAAKAEQAPSSIAPAAKPVTEPATETAAPPIPAAKAAAASAPAQKPSNSQITAIRSACRSDYQRNCVGVPTGGAATLQCLEKNKAHLSASCQKAVNAAGGGAPAPAASAAPAAAAPAGSGAAPAAAAPALALRPMRPREMLFVLRSACGADARSLCGDVSAGGGRIIQCLAAQAASLSPACADVLGQFAAQ